MKTADLVNGKMVVEAPRSLIIRSQSALERSYDMQETDYIKAICGMQESISAIAKDLSSSTFDITMLGSEDESTIEWYKRCLAQANSCLNEARGLGPTRYLGEERYSVKETD